MFRNCLSAAWGDLVRSPVQSFIAIGGLAIGLMAAIIAGVVTADAFTRDHFIPGHERLYFAVMEEHGPQTGDHYQTATPYNLADYIRALPGIGAIARIATISAVIRHGDVVARENLAWADTDFFRMYRPQVLHGDAGHALDRPDGLVVTLAAASKYFGRDDVVGQTLELNHVPFTVRAVIADWPVNQGQFASGLFASSLSPVSTTSADKGTQGLSRSGGLYADMTTMVQLTPGASRTELDRQAAALLAGFVPVAEPYRRSLHFERLDEINMSKRLNPDNRAHLYVMEAVTVVILVLSIVNFVNLSIARSAQRAMEVAVRKAAGAGRRALIAQFLGEAVLQASLALVIAIALAEWSLPAVNSFLGSGAVFDYWDNLLLDAAMLGGTVLVGALAGVWPALVLSAFRPAAVLKGWLRGTAGGNWLRQGFVILQFGVLIVFLISAGTAFRQNTYATREALRIDTSQTLMIAMPKCGEAFRSRLVALAGIRGAGCSVSPGFVATEEVLLRNSRQAILQMVPVGYGFLEIFGIKPLAGRLFSPALHDHIPPTGPRGPLHYVINQAAVRQLGYPNGEAAIGEALRYPPSAGGPGEPSVPSSLDGVIVGVIRDFSLNPESSARASGSRQIPATAYAVEMTKVGLPPPPAILYVKLDGRDIPETLAAIGAAWKQSGQVDPINQRFLDAFVQRQEQTVQREGQAFAVLAGIAMFLACLGLFGVSMLIAVRRIKEIGVRRAMGAKTGEILRLLLWQFARPVLWACLIAWPVAWWAMRTWLDSFIFHVDLDLWLFPAAGAAALIIAVIAVGGQALLVARQRPVLALRYE